jgi:hypothetical protein
MATSYGLMKVADQILDEAREVIAAEIKLKILKSSHDRLVNIAHTVEEEVGERSEEELIDLSDRVQNKCGARIEGPPNQCMSTEHLGPT